MCAFTMTAKRANKWILSEYDVIRVSKYSCAYFMCKGSQNLCLYSSVLGAQLNQSLYIYNIHLRTSPFSINTVLRGNRSIFFIIDTPTKTVYYDFK